MRGSVTLLPLDGYATNAFHYQSFGNQNTSRGHKHGYPLGGDGEAY